MIERFDRTPGSIPVPTDVFVETVNIVGKKLGHERAVAIGTTLGHEAPYLVTETTGDVLEEAFRLFGEQPASVSLTDCIVMATADRFETREIFGFDEVFRKHGYRAPSEASQEMSAA